MNDVVSAAATLAPAPAAAAPTPAAPAAAAPAVAAPAAPAVAPTAAAPAAAPAASPAAPAAPPLTLPGKDAGTAEWQAFYRSIGAPTSADGYKLEVPQGADPTFAKTAATWMAEAGLLPAQAEALSKQWNAHVAEQATLQESRAAEAAAAELQRRHTENVRQETALKTEWGVNHDANLAAAKQAIGQFVAPLAGDKVADIMTAVEGVIGYAATVKLFHGIGKGLATGQIRGVGAGEGGNAADAGKTAGERAAAAMERERIAREAGIVR